MFDMHKSLSLSNLQSFFNSLSINVNLSSSV